MIILWIIGWVLFLAFFAIVLRGAPFVPTHKGEFEALFSLYAFKKGEILVDLGSGDGRVLAAAANRGIAAVGYELNPFLVWYSRWRLRRQGVLAQTRMTDFWLAQLPQNTRVVYVFLAKPFMKKLERKLRRETARLGHDVLLVSYGMELTGKQPETRAGALIVYRFKP